MTPQQGNIFAHKLKFLVFKRSQGNVKRAKSLIEFNPKPNRQNYTILKNNPDSS